MMVGDVESFKADHDDFNATPQGLRANAGGRYSDYKAGDKIAEYGLMGLIGGGNAAVAIKTDVVGVTLAFVAKPFKALGAKGIFLPSLAFLLCFGHGSKIFLHARKRIEHVPDQRSARFFLVFAAFGF